MGQKETSLLWLKVYIVFRFSLLLKRCIFPPMQNNCRRTMGEGKKPSGVGWVRSHSHQLHLRLPRPNMQPPVWPEPPPCRTCRSYCIWIVLQLKSCARTRTRPSASRSTARFQCKCEAVNLITQLWSQGVTFYSLSGINAERTPTNSSYWSNRGGKC